MGVSDDDQAAATSSRERHRLLDLGHALGLYVDFRSGIEGLGPCMMDMLRGIAERDSGVEFGKLLS